MLDGKFKSRIDVYWEYAARPLIGAGLTPNQVTWMGLVLLAGNCALFAWHHNNLWFGLGLVGVFCFDSLDGAVARVTGRTTTYGGYLDAVADRYQEVTVYLCIAWVHDYWAVCFVAITGSLLVSYNKARTAVEVPIDNQAWPDLLERLERLVLICLCLMLDSFIEIPTDPPQRLLFWGIVVIGVLAHLTAVQRFLRARRLLIDS